MARSPRPVRPAALMAAMAALAACAAPPAPPAPTGAGPGAATADRGPARRLLALTPLAITSTAADSSLSTNPPRFLADGDLTTAWTNGGYRNATGWAQAGLAASAPITAVAIKTPPNSGAFDLQVSATGATWTTVRTGLSTTTWNLEEKALPAGTTARYVRVFWRNRATSPLPHFSIYELRLLGGTATGTPAPTPTPSATPTRTPSPTPTASGLICPTATTCYPAGTVFITGNVRVTVGPGGVFTPSRIYVRPGASTTFVNIDTVPHTVTGFNGATSNSGPLPPGGTYYHGWVHPGTWYFHDVLTPNPPTFAVTDVPL